MEKNSKDRYWCSTCQQNVPDLHRRVYVDHLIDDYPQSFYEAIEEDAERFSYKAFDFIFQGHKGFPSIK